MSARLSLADQLAAIRDPAAPVEEYDPESAPYDFSSGRSSSKAQKEHLDAGRADYLDVGESSLRKSIARKHAPELGGRYAGVKSSRDELFGGKKAALDGSIDGSDEDLDGDDNDEDEDDLEEEEELDEDEEQAGLEGEESGSEGEDPTEDDEEASGGEDDDEEDIPVAKATLKRSGKSSMNDDSRAMIQALKKASSADVEKGGEVRRQLSFWDTLLEARIRLQKCVTSVNVLPGPSSIPNYTDASSSDFHKTVASLEELSELLFSVRRTLYETNDKLTLSASASASRKRKRGSASYLDSALDELEQLSSVVSPYERTVISRWSDKVSAAGGSASSQQQNKFKAIGTQNTLSQIDGIVGQDMERLVERTRVRRSGGGRAAHVKVVGRDRALEPVEGEKDVSEEVFDDTDFYQALLREVVDASAGAGPASGLNGDRYAQFNNISKKKAAGVDVKASKGRKLRYHVHEKLQNFMAPIPMLTWEKEQTDELFRGLLGSSTRDGAQAGAEGMQDMDGDGAAASAGQLRIF